MTGQEIIHKYTKGKMSGRPEFYSGRGAILGDLNSDLLEMVYKGVKEEEGVKAAKNFVQMVYNMPKLSATAFLNTFYYFVGCGYKIESMPKECGSDIDVGPDDGGREAVGLATIFGAMFGDTQRDETGAIRSQFLRNHRSEYVGRDKDKDVCEYYDRWNAKY